MLTSYGPAISPASLSRRSDGLMCRLARTISIRVLVKLWLHDWFQLHLCHCLRDPIPDRWNSQDSGLSIRLWNFNRFDGWREVAAGTHPIPNAIEIVLELTLEVFNRFVVYPRGSFVRLDP